VLGESASGSDLPPFSSASGARECSSQTCTITNCLVEARVKAEVSLGSLYAAVLVGCRYTVRDMPCPGVRVTECYRYNSSRLVTSSSPFRVTIYSWRFAALNDKNASLNLFFACDAVSREGGGGDLNEKNVNCYSSNWSISRRAIRS
jgi:hypothetical protein